MNFYEELNWRGLKFQETAGLQDALKNPLTVYAGFDPTAESLHVGNLIPLLTLRRFQKSGHQAIVLVGGATGLIGDPSGKQSERTLQERAEVEKRAKLINEQILRIVTPDYIVDNADWSSNVPLLTFLRDIGKHFRINEMLARDSVKSRLENGISFTEFSYMLLQANDFWHLFQTFKCSLQIGGSDQWGNITAGIDLIRVKGREQAFGLTLPLLTTADGQKLGKTAQGAIWLDPEKTSPYTFFQYWMNLEDGDALRFLRLFLDEGVQEIEDIEALAKIAPETRHAQRVLAEKMTALIHGQDALNRCIKASDCLFKDGNLRLLDATTLKEISSHLPSAEFDAKPTIREALVVSGLAQSQSDALRQVFGGGVYINNTKCYNATYEITTDDLLQGRYVVIRRGKKNHAILIIKG